MSPKWNKLVCPICGAVLIVNARNILYPGVELTPEGFKRVWQCPDCFMVFDIDGEPSNPCGLFDHLAYPPTFYLGVA